MVMCAVFGCGKRTVRDIGVSFFRFPRIQSDKTSEVEELSKRRLNLWLSRVNRADLSETNLKHRRVCSLHFIKGKPADLADETNPDWAPSMILGHDKLKVNSSSADDRHKRCLKRSVSQVENEEVTTSNSLLTEVTIFTSSQCCVETQTDMTSKDISDLHNELNSVRKKLYDAEDQISSLTMSEDCFKNKVDKVKFYTGLPNFATLMVVLNFISSKVNSTERNTLSPFQELVVFLMRLRLNLTTQDLAYRFCISQSTVSRIFAKWLDAAFVCLKDTIIWPERENLMKSMPLSFKNIFGSSVVVILDCFEVTIDKPTSLITRAATWSQYKHHNTVKFLIGITPQGVISYISDAWGGRVSDKTISEQCGLLEKLLPGDKVMADRGFTICDSVGFYCAELILPSFTRGKTQLAPMDIHLTRDIAGLRIHVERVIGNVRQKYTILRGPIPVELLTKRDGDEFTPIDKIAYVCCAFTNLSPSVVSLT